MENLQFQLTTEQQELVISHYLHGLEPRSTYSSLWAAPPISFAEFLLAYVDVVERHLNITEISDEVARDLKDDDLPRIPPEQIPQLLRLSQLLTETAAVATDVSVDPEQPSLKMLLITKSLYVFRLISFAADHAGMVGKVRDYQELSDAYLSQGRFSPQKKN